MLESSASSKQYREVSVDRDESEIDVQQIPLPSKRKSLEVAKEIPITPPVVKPRTIIHKESIDDVTTVDSHENVDAIQIENMENEFIEDAPVFEKILPKSILKNSETNSNTKKIQFQDVSATDTSSEMDTDDSSDYYEEDPWNLVDQHRNALNRKHRNSPSPPPLPKTSPPSLDMDEPNKDYSLA